MSKLPSPSPSANPVEMTTLPQPSPLASMSSQDIALSPRRKFEPPARWEDHDYVRNEFRGARPVWEIEGKTFAGPRLVPEVIEPRTAREIKLAERTLFDLWHHACMALDGDHRGGHYHGVDANGRHRVT